MKRLYVVRNFAARARGASWRKRSSPPREKSDYRAMRLDTLAADEGSAIALSCTWLPRNRALSLQSFAGNTIPGISPGREITYDSRRLAEIEESFACVARSCRISKCRESLQKRKNQPKLNRGPRAAPSAPAAGADRAAGDHGGVSLAGPARPSKNESKPPASELATIIVSQTNPTATVSTAARQKALAAPPAQPLARQCRLV